MRQAAFSVRHAVRLKKQFFKNETSRLLCETRGEAKETVLFYK